MPKSVLKSTPDPRWFLRMTKINRINTLIPIPNSAHPKAAKTVAETEKAIKSFENNKSPGNDGLSAEFYKTFNELLKKDLHKLYIENSQLWQVPRSMRQTVISCLYKKETERT